MRFRNPRVRAKVTALLVSLTALWAFAAWVTIRDGLNLLWTSTINSGIVDPGEALLTELQKERRITLVRMGDSTRVSRADLQEQRKRTDAAFAELATMAKGATVDLAASDLVKQRLSDLLQRSDALKSARTQIDANRMDRVTTGQVFGDTTDTIFRLFNSIAVLDDDQVAKYSRTLIQMLHAREILSQEDALLAGVLSAGRMTDTERVHFAQLVGMQRFLIAEAVVELPQADRVNYQRTASSPAYTRLRTTEDQISRSSPPNSPLPIELDQWNAVVEAVLTQHSQAMEQANQNVLDEAMVVAVGMIVRLVVAGGLGLVAVIASIVLAITTSRTLIKQLEKLRDSALDLAYQRLPNVVARLAKGERVDISTEAPPLRFGDDVIGQVGSAFNVVQETAIRTAVEEAALRRSIRDILLSLARRTQSLVHRQLTLLDVMERRESEPSELKDLFRIDHLATRMRRNAENLIVLAGSTPARAWRRSVPMVDVVRGALAEVEDYTRVTVLPMGHLGLTGRAVGDVIHLLAELIENAVSFSPPYTSVQVGGQMVASGYAIEIEDRGLGMTPEDLADANDRIANPPEFSLSSTARLGLYVVSRLAERHAIKVNLKASPYGGTTAIVLLPRELVIEDETILPGSEAGPNPEREKSKIALVSAPVADSPHAQEVVALPSAPQSPRPVSPAAFTPSGLPFRVPQASLAPELANGITTPPDDDSDDRSPEEIRKIMGSFQRGTRQGRFEAAKLLEEGEGHQ